MEKFRLTHKKVYTIDSVWQAKDLAMKLKLQEGDKLVLEINVGGDWRDWEDEEGRGILEIINEEKLKKEKGDESR
jgi:N-methylhydantoinase B/oxoprolinase/acetone carboxylase alpha subunit